MLSGSITGSCTIQSRGRPILGPTPRLLPSPHGSPGKAGPRPACLGLALARRWGLWIRRRQPPAARECATGGPPPLMRRKPHRRPALRAALQRRRAAAPERGPSYPYGGRAQPPPRLGAERRGGGPLRERAGAAQQRGRPAASEAEGPPRPRPDTGPRRARAPTERPATAHSRGKPGPKGRPAGAWACGGEHGRNGRRAAACPQKGRRRRPGPPPHRDRPEAGRGGAAPSRARVGSGAGAGGPGGAMPQASRSAAASLRLRGVSWTRFAGPAGPCKPGRTNKGGPCPAAVAVLLASWGPISATSRPARIAAGVVRPGGEPRAGAWGRAGCIRGAGVAAMVS